MRLQVERDRLNATAEGLRQIGVAVAVWAGMAAVRDSDFFVRLSEARARRLIERSFTKCGPRKLRSWPIAGPRGVLP